MTQLSFLPQNYAGRTVNVSSVPQRSPFRYPGGKTWLIPWARQWLMHQRQKPQTLIEPFAGGGIVSLTAVFEGLVEQAVMVEIDESVSSVWRAILDGHAQWLANRIVEFDLTPENVREVLASSPSSLGEGIPDSAEKQSCAWWYIGPRQRIDKARGKRQRPQIKMVSGDAG